MRAAGMQNNQIKAFQGIGKKTSKKNLAEQLPKLKKIQEVTDEEIRKKQENVIAILQGTKLSEALNSPTRRKFFAEEKPSNKNLMAIT